MVSACLRDNRRDLAPIFLIFFQMCVLKNSEPELPDMVKAEMPFDKVDNWLVRASCEVEWYVVRELGHL